MFFPGALYTDRRGTHESTAEPGGGARFAATMSLRRVMPMGAACGQEQIRDKSHGDKQREVGRIEGGLTHGDLSQD